MQKNKEIDQKRLFKDLRIAGRTGQKRPNVYAKLEYNEEEKRYSIRIDDSENPEFWLSVTFSEDLLDRVKEEKEVFYGNVKDAVLKK